MIHMPRGKGKYTITNNAQTRYSNRHNPQTRLITVEVARRQLCTFQRATTLTVAILAQGTNRGDALCAALSFSRMGSSPSQFKSLT